MGRAPQNIAVAVLAVLIAACVAQRRPPNYSLDDMPNTSFDCRDKSIGGYYADPEADCQMFHVCVRLSNNEVQDFRFLCPNDTMFDQENQICANWFDIDCEANAEFYAKGFDLLRVGHGIANDDLLQKTPLVPERRLPPVNRQRDPEQDLFRGSSSSDIHRGRDEEDEEFERQNKKKAKVSVRRKQQQQQNRGRRPITTTFKPEDYTTELPEQFRSDQSVPEYTNINRQRTSTRVTPIPSSTTVQQQSTQQQTTQNQQRNNNNFQINVPNKQQEFQRGQQRNFQNAAPTGNDFQRTPQRNNAPNNNNEFQRTQQRNNQGSTTAPGNNDFQRNNGNNDFQRNNANNNDFQRNNGNNNEFQRTQQRNNFQTSAPSAPGDVPRTQPRPNNNNNDFQRNPQRNNFQNNNNNFQQQQPQQQQPANNNDFQRRGNFRGQQRHQVTAPQNNVQPTTFEATTAPTRSTTFYDNPTSLTPTYVSDFTSSSASQSFPSSTIAPTTYNRQNDQQFNPSTISPTTYNAFQQRKNLQRKNFPSTASPNSISNTPQRTFASTPAPSFQQSISPSQQSFTNDVTSRPIINNNNNFAPTTYRPRTQNNVPQPFQQSRRAQRPRDDFVNDNSEELLKTAHSSSFRASDLNAIQKSSVNYPSTTSSPFPAPSSPRTFTVPRQQQQQNRQQQQRPTEAPQQFNKQFFNNNASPNSQFTNNPSSQTPFVNPSTAQPNFFTGSTQDHSQNNFFTGSTPKPFNQNNNNNFNANQNNNNNFNANQNFNSNRNNNANQNNNNNFNSNRNNNANANQNNNFNANSNQNNNAFTSSSPKPNNFNNNNNNQNGFTATSKSNNFNNNPTQNGFAATSPKPQRQNSQQFNTQAPRDNSNNNNNFFNPSTARPVNNQFTGNIVSSTPQPFSQKQAFVPSTPQPFQQRASSFTQPPQQQSTPEDDGKPKKPNKKANSDYDYAYYDETPIDDYEGIEHISEFTKTHKG